MNSLRRLILALVGLTLPFEYYSISSTFLIITPNKLVTAALLAFVGIQWAIDRRPLPRDRKRLWLLFLTVMIGISAIQSIASGILPIAVRNPLITWYTLFLFYLLLTYTIRSRVDLDLLFRSFIVGVILALVSGWLGYGENPDAARYGGLRIAGEGSNPNLLAFNLLIAIAAAGSLYFTASTRARAYLYLGWIGVMTAGVAATLSRSGIIALGLMAGFWVLRSRRAGLLRFAVPALLLGGLAVYFAPEAAVNRLSTLTPEGVQSEWSARGRIVMFPDTWAALKSNPVTGVGLGAWRTFAEGQGRRPNELHSAYLHVIAEHGLLGFLPFITVLLLGWGDFSRARREAHRHRQRRDPEMRKLELRAQVLQVGYFGILVMSLAQPSMRHKTLWMMVAIATAVLGLVRRQARVGASLVEPSAVPWTPELASGFGFNPGVGRDR